jgi:hypothetical protein
LLQHVSREIYRGAPLHFGRAIQHRYDDPGGIYGVLYLAYNLPTALMESAFHKHRWWRVGARRKITLSEVRSRMVRIVGVGAELTLCDLVSEGAATQAFGLNASQLVTRRYGSTRALSARIARLTASSGAPFDGILYPSHNNPGARCIALFNRAAGKICVHEDLRLDEHTDWPAFVRDFDVAVLPR